MYYDNNKLGESELMTGPGKRDVFVLINSVYHLPFREGGLSQEKDETGWDDMDDWRDIDLYVLAEGTVIV